MSNKNRVVTLCCGNGDSKTVIFFAHINYAGCFCRKCAKPSVLMFEDEFKKLKRTCNDRQ